MIQCIIFDNDGTLVDSEHLCNSALVTLLQNYNINENIETLTAQFRGWKLDHIITSLEAKHKVQLPNAFIADYRQLVTSLFKTALQPIAGIKEALATINLPMCVASSGPLAKIEQALAVTGLAPFFGNNIFSAYTINSWKPEPHLFLYAAQMMGVSPQRCVVVEDSKIGIEAAQRAGMRAYWFTPPANGHPQAADVIQFHSMSALPRLLMATIESRGP